MARPLYSAALYVASGLHVTDTVEVEPGFAWVVRDVSAYTSDVNCHLDFSDYDTNALWIRFRARDLIVDPANVLEWHGRHVINHPGEEFAAGFILTMSNNDVEDAGWDIYVSGYVLENP